MPIKPAPLLRLLTASTLAFLLVACEDPATEQKPTEQKPTEPARESTPKQDEAPSAEAPVPSAEITPPTAEVPSAGPNGEADGIKDPVATVNGEAITRKDLDDALGEAISAHGMRAEDLTLEQRMEGYRQILDDLIIEKLVTKAASGVEVSEEEVQAEIDKIKSNFPTEQEFEMQLQAMGQSPDKLSETLSKMMQQRRWMETQIGDSIEVTEDDAKKFYDENLAEFERPEQAKASHILFLVKPDDAEEKSNEQLAKAKAAAERANKGEDFGSLARELSEEPGAAQSSGDLGLFTKEMMVPEFSEAAFSLEPGQISEPVRTQFGWHVIKLEEKNESGMTPFEEVKDQIEAFLKTNKERVAVQGILKDLRDKADVDNTLAEEAPEADAPAAEATPADQ